MGALARCALDFQYRVTDEEGRPTDRARLWAVWRASQDLVMQDVLKYLAALAARG